VCASAVETTDLAMKGADLLKKDTVMSHGGLEALYDVDVSSAIATAIATSSASA
jgi:hypothetical protein